MSAVISDASAFTEIPEPASGTKFESRVWLHDWNLDVRSPDTTLSGWPTNLVEATKPITAFGVRSEHRGHGSVAPGYMAKVVAAFCSCRSGVIAEAVQGKSVRRGRFWSVVVSCINSEVEAPASKGLFFGVLQK